MTFNDLKSFFHAKTDSALADRLNVSKAVVHKWKKNGIPVERQAVIQIQTNGALKANIEQIQAETT